MNSKKKPHETLKQSKITNFCLNKSDNSKSDGIINKKRKNDEEMCEFYSTSKKIKVSNSTSPDKFFTLPEKKIKNNVIENEKKNIIENFVFEDFENESFLNPGNKKCPKKNVLSEHCEDENWKKKESQLNFETPMKCRVLKFKNCANDQFEQVLFVKNEKLNKIGICKLRDVWTSLSFSVDDVVSILAFKSEKEWIVDNKNGYIILHPDFIISSTSLVSSMFCLRQGILSNFYRGIIGSCSSSKMLIGRLIHEFFQKCLEILTCSDEDFTKIVKGFMQSRNYLRDFYFCDLKELEIQKEMENFIPHIKNFLDLYVNKKKTSFENNFKGTIQKVLDIEELIKSPCLGIQGRIDVTVKIKSEKSERIVPLELKTGKASFSVEHRSQLILYILLMNELGRKVESGLLLYLKEDKMEEILPQRSEIRNLLLLRNHFVNFYKNFQKYDLPDPIRNVKACSMCPYLRICTSYMKSKEYHKISESHPLRNIDIPDIKVGHVDYFVKWNKMLWLEYGKVFNKITENFEISNLKLEVDIENFNKGFKHNFYKTVESERKALQPGTLIHVINGKNSVVGLGQVVEDTDLVISIAMDKRLDDFFDVYKISVFQSKLFDFYLGNLGWFLEEQFEALRQIIIDKRFPTFQEKFDKKDFMEKCLKNLIVLNKQQQIAVLKSLLCNDYLLIKGPPGTGKTQTIVALIKILVAFGKNVLIASHTHSSIDNILLRILDVEFLRLGALKNVHKDIYNNCYANLVRRCSSISDIQKLFERKVVASTCCGIDADFVLKKKFDICIIDESSQVLQPEILRPLFCCQKFILVGDEDQLPPIVQNLEAKILGMDKSMFEWLINESAIVTLKFQYRMNFFINSLANSIAYNGLIQCADENVAKATMKIKNWEIFFQSDKWIIDVLSNDLEKSVVFVDTSNYFEWKGAKIPDEPRSSMLEANLITTLITHLIKFGIREECIGVIAPFSDQITLLKKKLNEKNLIKVELNTVDQYQGRDKEVILFSCTKENQRNKEAADSELLNDRRRLTVAVTRAKHKLILLGDRQTVIKYRPFQKLVESLQGFQIISLINGEKSFLWENIID